MQGRSHPSHCRAGRGHGNRLGPESFRADRPDRTCRRRIPRFSGRPWAQDAPTPAFLAAASRQRSVPAQEHVGRTAIATLGSAGPDFRRPQTPAAGPLELPGSPAPAACPPAHRSSACLRTLSGSDGPGDPAPRRAAPAAARECATVRTGLGGRGTAAPERISHAVPGHHTMLFGPKPLLHGREILQIDGHMAKLAARTHAAARPTAGTAPVGAIRRPDGKRALPQRGTPAGTAGVPSSLSRRPAGR